MGQQLAPLEVCERIIGPIPVIAAICGKTLKAPYLWRRPSTTRDKGDIPSAPDMRRLLAYARRHGLPLTADHLIHGADADELAALMAQAAGQVGEAA